ncbi:PREDICTED: NAC transcription factor 29-like [Nelumbo nucifera]|uniref:NAC transcription factor 29-like n=2 Tax=Nelumbo nucifera TaxID=4432 RepID=A0A1U8A051_NELNU|nr:PREDICTED: NAC transcription factor 29-like [Nelumbo nucifera]DAD34921.1 TPA_asm: hypothetical protein HUJ06_005561 [Nelumbo nucifera]
MEGTKKCALPPGFRFHPTDEELIMYYLRNQARSMPCPVSIIPEVDIYKFDPWELPEKAEFGETEWYFFSPRERKYPNGVRPNRATSSGYWKATGTDKAIHSGSTYVGVKKALVFYKGRPPKGVKTDWIMHEYRLDGSSRRPNKLNGSMKLDDWVLCRIYKKKHLGRAVEQQKEEPSFQETAETSLDASEQQQPLIFPRTCSLAHLLEVEYLSISHLLNDNSALNSPPIEFRTTDESNSHDVGILHSGDMDFQFPDPTSKFQVNQNTVLNQPIFINPLFDFQ